MPDDGTQRTGLESLVTPGAVPGHGQVGALLGGGVARRTGTASPLGARFDMEVDAVQGVVLTVVVSALVPWVVTVGAGAGALAALGWSFARDVIGQWQVGEPRSRPSGHVR